jgi:hypothetical protein
MSAPVHTRDFLLGLAVEALAPVVPGCAGPADDNQGERPAAFGRRIAERWLGWLRLQPPDEAVRALARLAALAPEEARREAAAALDRLTPDAYPGDRAVALDYLASIPGCVHRSLVLDPVSGSLTLPPGLAPDRPETLLQLLPAGDPPRRGGWAGERPGKGDGLQTEPTPPDALPALDVPDPRPPGGGGRYRQSSVVTKLRILLRCHAVARRAALKRLLVRTAVMLGAMLAGGALGGLAGGGVFWAVYRDPHRYAQAYREGMWISYYVKGSKVTQPEYDYFVATNSNEETAVAAGVATGVGVFLAVSVGAWLVTRRRGGAGPDQHLEEQIAAIVKSHPEAVQDWGGPSVLRERDLVEEVLRITEAGRPGPR